MSSGAWFQITSMVIVLQRQFLLLAAVELRPILASQVVQKRGIIQYLPSHFNLNRAGFLRIFKGL